MNKTMHIGRLTKDIELRYTQKGTAVATFTLAVNRRFKQEGQSDADFFPVVVWGATGENAARYVGKGSRVGISGRLQTRTYETDNGKRYITEIVAEEVEFLDSKGTNKGSVSKQAEMDDFVPMDEAGDDLPF
jgi:single-strand DNA-binding protein